MGFSVKSPEDAPPARKRLARNRSKVDTEHVLQMHPLQPSQQLTSDIFIAPYTPKSFVVMGDTLNHSSALIDLGGKYNTSLRIGQGWIFAKVREESVQHYIKTGEVIPYVYKAPQMEPSVNTVIPAESYPSQFKNLFYELRNAFDADAEYEGHSIIDVIYQFEEKYSKQME